MIKVLIGNIFDSKAKTLVNTVNCVGIMGKGIAKEFKTKYPDMYKQYKRKCERNEIKTGEPYIYNDLKGARIINFPTKGHWKNNAKLDDIIKGLDIFIENYKEWGIKSIAFPPLGCGNGQLDWEYVGPIIYNKLKNLDIDIEVYAPYGTNRDLLTEEYLSRYLDFSDIKRRLRLKVKPEWIIILKVVKNLGEIKYAKPVGRTIFQKICFAAEQENIANFNFRQESYGPFSPEIKPTLSTLANNNIIHENEVGQMIELKIGKEYEKFEKKYEKEIKDNLDKIQKITDLFQRIRNTEQAEEVATVLWIERKLKKKNEIISDSQVIEKIIKWKPKWQDEEKLMHIYDAILNLNLLGWTNIKIKNQGTKNFIKDSI